MKLGRKGFMLAEVVVVAVVIATVLVTLFTGLNNMTSAYETRNRYYDVDSLYAAMEINDILIRENKINNLKENNEVVVLYDKDSDKYSVNSFIDFYGLESDDNKTIGYSIDSTYFVPYNEKGLNSLGSKDINATFKDYVKYLSGNLIFTEDYDYMIIIERQNNNDVDDCYYYALKLKY